jgi:hypothetical protein
MPRGLDTSQFERMLLMPDTKNCDSMKKYKTIVVDTLPITCCGILERMGLEWMRLDDGTKCIPYIKGHSDGNLYRVNNCPSCGKYVRDIIVRAE